MHSRSRRSCFRAALAAGLFLPGAAPLVAQNIGFVWNGAVDSNLGSGSNWIGGIAPANNSSVHLVFPQTFTLPLANGFTLQNPVDLTSSVATFTVTVTNAGVASLAGTLAGAGAMTKSGAGELRVDGLDSVRTTVTSGTLTFTPSSSFVGSVAVTNNSVLSLEAGAVVNASSYAVGNGGIVRSGGIRTITGPVIVGSGGGRVEAVPDGFFNLNGAITGPGTLTVQGAGRTTFNASVGVPLVITAGTTVFGSNSVVAQAVEAREGGTIVKIMPGPGFGPSAFTWGNDATLEAAGNLTLTSPMVVGSGGGKIQGINGGVVALLGNVTGSAPLRFQGGGALSLQGNNGGFGGGLVVVDGRVDGYNSNSFGTGLVTLTGGGLGLRGTFALANNVNADPDADPNTIDVSTGNSVTLNGVIGGIGPIVVGSSTARGTLVVTNVNNAFTGDVSVTFGTLALSSLPALGAGTGPNVKVLSGATLAANFAFDDSLLARLDSTSAGTIALGANNSNNLNFNAANIGESPLSLGATGDYTYSGTLTPGADGFRFGGGGGVLTVASNLANNKVTVTGGRVNLTGTNTNPNFYVNSGGVLLFEDAAAVGGVSGVNRKIHVLAGGAAGPMGALDQDFLGRFHADSLGAVVLATNSSNNLDFSGLTNLSLGTTGNFTYSGVLTPAGSTYRLGGGTGQLTVAANLTGSNSVVIAPGGEVALTGSNDYTGTLTVAGTLRITASDDWESPFSSPVVMLGGALHATASLTTAHPITINSQGGALVVDGDDTLMLNGLVDGSGGLTKSGAGTLALGANNTYAGGTTLKGGTLLVGADAQLGATNSRVTFDGGTFQPTVNNLMTTRPATLAAGGGTINTPTGINLEWNGPIDGTGSLTKMGPGGLLLTGANIYTGDTLVNEGTLKIGFANSLSPNSKLYVAPGATFDANGFAQTFSDLSGSGNLNVGTAGLAFQPSGSSTYTGALSGGGGFTMSGTGTLTLSGTNTYSGTTAITSGIVKLGASAALPASPVNVSSGATLDLDGHAATATKLEGAGNVSLGGAAFTLNQSDNTTFTGIIDGSGGIVKQGTGVLTLAGANTFSGNATISAGTLKLDAAGALPAGTVVDLSSGAVLDLNSNAATIGKLAGAGNVALGSATLTVSQADPATFTGVISGSGGFSKSGSGLLTVTGTQIFTGPTTITEGRLKLNGSLATSAVTVAGGTLSGTGTVGSLTISSGGILAPGNSPGTMPAGATLWAGGGTLQFEINSTAGTPGANPGWDLLAITGGLTISATSGDKFIIAITSLTLGDVAGNVSDFVSTGNYSFIFATTTEGISNYSADNFLLNTDGFSNPFGGTWSIAESGGTLSLNYAATAIPEPGATAALAGLVALGLVTWRRLQPAGRSNPPSEPRVGGRSVRS